MQRGRCVRPAAYNARRFSVRPSSKIMNARLARKHDYEAGKLTKRLRRQVGQAIADLRS